MDPDVLTQTNTINIIILGASILLSLIMANGLGGLIVNYREAEHKTILGFSYATAGVGALCFGFFGISAYFAHSLLGHIFLGWLWLIIFYITIASFFVLFLALGIIKSKTKPNGFLVKILASIAVFIGFIITLPATLIFKMCKLNASSDVTEEDVLHLVDSLMENEEDETTVDETQKDMISGVFELDDITASDIMTHRTDVVAVNQNATASEVCILAAQEGKSRLPVFNQRLDNITGILYVKDLLTIFGDSEKADLPITNFVRKAMFVPESCRAKDLLVEFKAKHTQLAVVVDEYGGTSGIVTMEDVLEEIVGNIQDEYDDEEEPIIKAENGYICDASIDLEDIFEAFDLPLPQKDQDDSFESISGLITERLGRIPLQNEAVVVDFGGLSFKVTQVDHNHILKVNAFVCAVPEQTV